jgi:hypothetical protein
MKLYLAEVRQKEEEVGAKVKEQARQERDIKAEQSKKKESDDKQHK